MPRRLVALVILFMIIALPVRGDTEHPADYQQSFDQALVTARETGKFVLVDAFTTWCGPCKAFQNDFESTPALQDMLNRVVFLSIDIEDSTSAAFSEAYPVASVPQFILMDAEGVEYGRIVGYGGVEGFKSAFEALMADPVPNEERLARAAADETWGGASAQGDFHRQRKEYEQAAPFYAEALDRGAPGEVRLELIFAYLVGMGEGWATVDPIRPVAEAAAAHPDTVERYWFRLYTLMRQVADKSRDDSLRQPSISKAYAEAEAEGTLEHYTGLRFDYAHYVQKDFDAAADVRREEFKYGDDPWRRNLYCWYCFENQVQLEEAEAVAREGIAMEADPRHIAMLMDTLAELVYLKGETEEARELVERCIELDPENTYYHDQKSRFEAVE